MDFPKNHLEVKDGFRLLKMKDQIQIHENSIYHMDFFGEGSRIVTASADKSCKVIDLLAGKEVL